MSWFFYHRRSIWSCWLLPGAENRNVVRLRFAVRFIIFFSSLRASYYLKTVKAFGEDARRAAELFQKRGVTRALYNREAGFIQFHPEEARHLKSRAIELALSVNVREQRDGEFVTRELKLMRAEPDDCKLENL